MKPTTAQRIVARWSPAFRDLGCAIFATRTRLIFESDATGRQVFYLTTSSAQRVEAHAPGFLRSQPLPREVRT